jgi:hypothetical protein
MYLPQKEMFGVSRRRLKAGTRASVLPPIEPLLPGDVIDAKAKWRMCWDLRHGADIGSVQSFSHFIRVFSPVT